ncbi:Zinc-binding dehydrogenase [Popillia japonica]|uniref:Prostaglandin reductase 1 n=1 Tax=Popillia japonica TaxID=7064 RepID=A0AAW1L9L9_POPJA
MKAKRFVLEKYFEGMPKESDLKLVEEELPEITDGEFLVEAVYLSVDPYMRAYVSGLKLGQTMIGCQVAKILQSKNSSYPVGRYVSGQFGWTTHFISNGKAQDITNYPPFLIPEDNNVPLSLFLGILGRPGNSAYFGLLDICNPQPGETVVVTGAGGAVGYHVGQIAKIKGCTVVGITGSDEKGAWLKRLGFDHVINYKTEDISLALDKAVPEGIDCYFDNVGGEISSCVIQRMNKYGRIAVCGSISMYNATAENYPTARMIQPFLVTNELYMKGFIVGRTYLNRWMEAIDQNTKWYKEGKLQNQETVTEGFEHMPKAFIGIMSGDNWGKAIIKP